MVSFLCTKAALNVGTGSYSIGIQMKTIEMHKCVAPAGTGTEDLCAEETLLSVWSW